MEVSTWEIDSCSGVLIFCRALVPKVVVPTGLRNSTAARETKAPQEEEGHHTTFGALKRAIGESCHLPNVPNSSITVMTTSLEGNACTKRFTSSLLSEEPYHKASTGWMSSEGGKRRKIHEPERECPVARRFLACIVMKHKLHERKKTNTPSR